MYIRKIEFASCRFTVRKIPQLCVFRLTLSNIEKYHLFEFRRSKKEKWRKTDVSVFRFGVSLFRCFVSLFRGLVMSRKCCLSRSGKY